MIKEKLEEDSPKVDAKVKSTEENKDVKKQVNDTKTKVPSVGIQPQ